MKLLLITNLYPPQELGGYGRSLADFTWGLQKRGHKIDVLTSDAQYLGNGKGLGPEGEKVNRNLILKGSFDGGVSLIENTSTCKGIDYKNGRTIEEAFGKEKYDGILLGNIDLLGHEIINILLQYRVPILHHIGFMTAPYEVNFYPPNKNYHMLTASNAVRNSLTKEGFPIDIDSVVYPGARTDLLGQRITKRPWI